MNVIGGLAMLFLGWGLIWGVFDRKFLPLALIGLALSGLYFYGTKGAHTHDATRNY